MIFGVEVKDPEGFFGMKVTFTKELVMTSVLP